MCKPKSSEHRSEFWPEPSAHQTYWETHHNPHVFTYNPADDGPEVEIIRYFFFEALVDAVFS